MISDQFMEEATIKQRKGLETVLYVFMWIAMIVFGIIAIFMFSAFTNALQLGAGAVEIIFDIVICLACAGCVVYAYFNKDKIRTEYEYTITNAQMDFAAVYNNNKRKNLGTMNLKNITACGEVASGSFNRYINMQGVKRSNWFVNREANLFYIYFQKEDTRRIIIIEPSEEMVKMIKRVLPQGVYQVN
ncbi:MAG: hypothetical protein CW338_03485 [Clostridiales bacterium]|nr:hypothetical protein [Clostridiales bacterium]